MSLYTHGPIHPEHHREVEASVEVLRDALVRAEHHARDVDTVNAVLRAELRRITGDPDWCEPSCDLCGIPAVAIQLCRECATDHRVTTDIIGRRVGY